MSLFTQCGLPPETLTLTFGPVRIQKFSWQFRQWRGDAPERTHGSKPVVESEGKAAFAEIAIIPILKQHGFEGAVWRDNWRRCFRDNMPRAKCLTPEPVREIYEQIVTVNGGSSGCWDVLAWNGASVAFIECKWRTDRIKPSQKRWLESALKVGLRENNFAICEWVIDNDALIARSVT